MMKLANAKDLPIYYRAIARYPHLAYCKPARPFCCALCRLAAVPTITLHEYLAIARVANGDEWLETRP